jgi:hypothetical protein
MQPGGGLLANFADGLKSTHVFGKKQPRRAKRRLPPVLFNLQVPNTSRGANSDRQSPDTFDQKPKK